MTYAELAKERDDLKIENETLRAIMDKMIEKGKSLEKENELLKILSAQTNAGIVNCSGCKLVEINAVKEFVEKLEQAICDNTYPYFDKDGKPVNIWNTDGFDKIDELLKQYSFDKIEELLKQYDVEVEE